MDPSPCELRCRFPWTHTVGKLPRVLTRWPPAVCRWGSFSMAEFHGLLYLPGFSPRRGRGRRWGGVRPGRGSRHSHPAVCVRRDCQVMPASGKQTLEDLFTEAGFMTVKTVPVRSHAKDITLSPRQPVFIPNVSTRIGLHQSYHVREAPCELRMVFENFKTHPQKDEDPHRAEPRRHRGAVQGIAADDMQFLSAQNRARASEKLDPYFFFHFK